MWKRSLRVSQDPQVPLTRVRVVPICEYLNSNEGTCGGGSGRVSGFKLFEHLHPHKLMATLQAARSNKVVPGATTCSTAHK